MKNFQLFLVFNLYVLWSAFSLLLKTFRLSSFLDFGETKFSRQSFIQIFVDSKRSSIVNQVFQQVHLRWSNIVTLNKCIRAAVEIPSRNVVVLVSAVPKVHVRLLVEMKFDTKREKTKLLLRVTTINKYCMVRQTPACEWFKRILSNELQITHPLSSLQFH